MKKFMHTMPCQQLTHVLHFYFTFMSFIVIHKHDRNYHASDHRLKYMHQRYQHPFLQLFCNSYTYSFIQHSRDPQVDTELVIISCRVL